MSLEAARAAGVAIAAAVALASLYDLGRRRSLASLEVALYLAAFAVLVAGVTVGLADIPLTWFALVAVAGIAAPYLLLRIADHFLAVSRVARTLAIAGLVYSVGLNVWLLVIVYRLEGTQSTQPTPDPLAATPMLLYLVGTLGYCGWIFGRASLRGSGATTWRARLASIASLLVTLAIAQYAVFTFSARTASGLPRPPAAAVDAFSLILAAASVGYFMAFAAPPWLRQMWRLAELHRFLRATSETSIGERGPDAVAALVDATRRATGATDAAVVHGGEVDASPRTIAVPVSTGGREFGTLVARFRREPLFPGDDAAIMRLMAETTAIALANDELFRERRELEERERSRIRLELEKVEQDLEVARRIQLSLLPRSRPVLDGWTVGSFYRPAREVGGDLYDFLSMPDGSLAVVIGDASGHGMAAALVMATARSEVRAAAAVCGEPGAILARANSRLVDAMPPSTFVTCMIVVIDAGSGRARYANAGHDVPYARLDGGIRELRARGMPLGLMPESTYEEFETTLAPGELLLLYTDGIVEAHGPDRRSMFGFERLRDLVARADDDPTRVVLRELEAFTGPAWEQEDDITIISVRRAPL